MNASGEVRSNLSCTLADQKPQEGYGASRCIVESALALTVPAAAEALAVIEHRNVASELKLEF